MIKLTNERIDILTKNAANSFKTITKILENCPNTKNGLILLLYGI